ncbi:MAG: DUF2442 domain-containing protein [Ahrensia sp.]
MADSIDETDFAAVPRLQSVEPVVDGVLKISWRDGFEGIVDLRPLIARNPHFEVLADVTLFRTVKVDENGHSVYWGEPDSELVDFGSDQARRWCLEQAAILQQAS